MTLQWGVVVLAAGAGKRMGGVPKCLITADGVPLLLHLLHCTAALQPAAILLVLGHHAPAIRSAVQSWSLTAPPQLVVNETPGEHPASSLRLGLHALLALPQKIDAVMVLLADQPLFTAKDLQEARSRFENRAAALRILWPVHGEAPGHPVVLDADLARAWLANPGAGLRGWAQQTPAQVAVWQTDHGRNTTDVDTPADLVRLAEQTGQTWQLPPLV